MGEGFGRGLILNMIGAGIDDIVGSYFGYGICEGCLVLVRLLRHWWWFSLISIVIGVKSLVPGEHQGVVALARLLYRRQVVLVIIGFG